MSQFFDADRHLLLDLVEKLGEPWIVSYDPHWDGKLVLANYAESIVIRVKIDAKFDFDGDLTVAWGDRFSATHYQFSVLDTGSMSIRVSVNKPLDRVAAEITRRLLPKARPELARRAAKAAAEQADNENRRTLLEDLAKRVKGETRNLSARSNIRGVPDDVVAPHIKITPSFRYAVDFAVHVPNERAREFATLLGAFFANTGTANRHSA